MIIEKSIGKNLEESGRDLSYSNVRGGGRAIEWSGRQVEYFV